MKLERSAPVKVGTLSDIDVLVTDNGISNEFLELCTQHNVDVKIATPAA
jgi:DeoR/GlpR family transcriptional regulator of sugar metabolism